MSKPSNPQNAPKRHGHKPPPPPPHRDNGSMCRLGKAVGARILLYLAATTLAIAGGW